MTSSFELDEGEILTVQIKRRETLLILTVKEYPGYIGTARDVDTLLQKFPTAFGEYLEHLEILEKENAML